MFNNEHWNFREWGDKFLENVITVFGIHIEKPGIVACTLNPMEVEIEDL